MARKARASQSEAPPKPRQTWQEQKAILDAWSVYFSRPVSWLDAAAWPELRHEVQLRVLDDQLAGYDAYAAAVLRTSTDPGQQDLAADIQRQTQHIRAEINRGATISALTLAIDLGIIWHQGVVEYRWKRPAHLARQRGGQKTAAQRRTKAQEIRQAIETLKGKRTLSNEAAKLSDEAAVRAYLKDNDSHEWYLLTEAAQHKHVAAVVRRLSRARQHKP